jgi:hypothetical protein
MSVMTPQAHIPWIGNISQLSTLHKSSQYFPLPLKTLHSSSYSFNKNVYNVPTINSDALQTDFQKILRYSRSVPQKQQLLLQE